ncbi:MAG: hypothetical protein ACN6OP_19450, partial [Pseudomonadales bacterium]
GNTACLRWAPAGPGWGLHGTFKLCSHPANPCGDGLMQWRLGAFLLKLAETVSGMGNFGNEMVW